MPSTTRGRRAAALLAAAAGLALVATTLSQPTAASAAIAAPDGARTAATAPAVNAKQDRKWQAKAALKKVKKAFAADTPAAERPDATMALRDLALFKDALGPRARAAADVFSQRPNTKAQLDAPTFALHYNPGKVKYDINAAFATMQSVVDTYAAAGYRLPKPDRGKGGDDRIDIYLTQLPPGFYGFCTTDQRVRLNAKKFDVWAYCVLDQDYKRFPRTPIENFTVTAAHEYFHAVQFTYDIREDPWLLEATAAWAEDELFTTINDNYQYLANSPITRPGRPIDQFEGGGSFHYGVWNFFRYLTEKFPAKTGPLASLVLSIIQNTDSSQGKKSNLYSTQAVDRALQAIGTSFAEQFALYSAATRYSRQAFSEGAQPGTVYPVKRARKAGLKGGKRAKYSTRLDHLSSETVNFRNKGGATALSLKIRMAKVKAGSAAVAVVYGADGAVQSVQQVGLSRKGRAKLGLPFDATVRSVDVTLVNTSTKYRRCYSQLNASKFPNPVACYGVAVHDGIKASVKGKAV